MGKAGAAQIVIAVLLIAAALSPLGLSVDEDGDVVPPKQAPAGGTLDSAFSGIEGAGDERRALPAGGSGISRAKVDIVDQKVRFVAKLKESGDLPAEVKKYGDVYTRKGALRIRGEIPLSAVQDLSKRQEVQAVRIDDPAEVEERTDRISPGIETIGADRLHGEGITGENVTVGIIDSGFLLAHPSIADSVGAYRVFSGEANPAHGTAVASVVADTAPGADLHLAAIGHRTSASEYRSAVEWLRESGVDVVIDAGSYFGQPGDGSGTISRIASEAADDLAFVTSSGNYARRHWAGVHRPHNDSGYVDVAKGFEGNRLDEGNPISGRVAVGLSWNGTGDYDIYLVKEGQSGDMVVAGSNEPGDGGSHEYLTATVPRGRYYVAVYPNSTATTTRPHRLKLFASHDLRYSSAAGSITAPATADGALVVGAYADGAVEPFSSRGPTVDGRRGVDLVAPDDVRVDGVRTGGGTSFAAPYVAGTIALLKDAYPSLSVETIEEVVTVSARDVYVAGADPVTGYGLVDVQAAMARARTRAIANGSAVDWTGPDPDAPESP